jgi:hypothetical protein
MNSRKSLDLSTQGIKDLFFALEKLPNHSPITAILAMLGWGYTDEDLWVLCNEKYIQYSKYSEAVFTFFNQTTGGLR